MQATNTQAGLADCWLLKKKKKNNKCLGGMRAPPARQAGLSLAVGTWPKSSQVPQHEGETVLPWLQTGLQTRLQSSCKAAGLHRLTGCKTS
jgi:hypothetical protein